MSNGVHNSARSPLGQTPSASKPGLVPTNSVTYTTTGPDGQPLQKTVRARIEPTLTVADVVKQLCINLKMTGSPTYFALRDEKDELVTNENLRKMIKNKVNLKCVECNTIVYARLLNSFGRLVNAPRREAGEIADKIAWREENLRDDKLKLTLFSLQKYIKEEEFASSFIEHAGLGSLVDVIATSHGNTLAYALAAMQNLMELEYGWETLSGDFILRIVQILSSPHSLINVCRPATAILKKLVEADPRSFPGTSGVSTSQGTPVPGSIYRYGFGVVFEQMRKEPGFLQTVISRLGSADTAMAQYSMMLINSLLSHADDAKWEEFITQLENLNVRKAVARLMSSHTIDDLMSCILDFQANMIRIAYRKKTTPIDPQNEPAHYKALNNVWESSGIEPGVDQQGETLKWRKLGFDTEDVAQEFSDVGVLGLECLVRFSSMIKCSILNLSQLSRPQERRCPIARASNEVVELLSEHWAIFAPGYSTSTAFQPFFLEFYRVHVLVAQFFIRMWNESGAVQSDFARVVALAHSQIKHTLKNENSRKWYEVEHDLLQCEYRTVRDRQMKELELEDDLLSKIPVRNLRSKLYKESYEFVRQQRIQCLFQGAWFVNAVPSSPQTTNRRPSRPWRFMRLDNGLKYIHYVDSTVKFLVRAGLEDLPERIEVAAISEIATGTCALPPGVLRDASDLSPNTNAPLEVSPLSFSLMSVQEGSLADVIAADHSRWADWTDGLNMLRRDGGHVTSKETAGYVHALTEIGLKIQLLNLSGEMVEIPSGLAAGPSPMNTDFFFSDLI
ncbi:hypothetical protein FISHEDRAFT_33437 [Fistulina hepatica ATCC 64428]|uniref:ELMO domain-containing protein n=1 Tax=Fistulina hepatica ATCC 64428 TaxID=1128425 RepID=A0A0D7AP81_9AGAR|nr:hypothetical protein FISHEDRAFT_33437 [Fistulina hepatica ATCC 64428]